MRVPETTTVALLFVASRENGAHAVSRSSFRYSRLEELKVIPIRLREQRFQADDSIHGILTPKIQSSENCAKEKSLRQNFLEK